MDWKQYAFVEPNRVYNYEEDEASVDRKRAKALHIWRKNPTQYPESRDKMLCGQQAPETGWYMIADFSDLNIQSIDDVLDYAHKWEQKSSKWHFCQKCYASLYKLSEDTLNEKEQKPKRAFKLPSGNRLKILQKLLAAGADQRFVNWVDVMDMRDMAQASGIQYIEGQGNVYVQDPKLEKAVNDIYALEEKFIEVQRGTGGEWVKLLPETVEGLSASE